MLTVMDKLRLMPWYPRFEAFATELSPLSREPWMQAFSNMCCVEQQNPGIIIA
jgi:hypothetical protein